MTRRNTSGASPPDWPATAAVQQSTANATHIAPVAHSSNRRRRLMRVYPRDPELIEHTLKSLIAQRV
jgi:hypothetical protein